MEQRSPSGPIEAITFDHWNTLVDESGETSADLHRARVARWQQELEAIGAPRDADAVGGALVAAWVRFGEAWDANRQFHAADAVAAGAEHLGVELPAATRDRLVDVLHDTSERDLALLPDAEEGLRSLHGAGVRLGIICDVGMTPSRALRDNLDHHGVLSLFSHWSFSDDVGAYKPFPAIFRHALEGLGVDDPARAAHVGDRRKTDVAGALGAGMVAVRYTGVVDDPPAEGMPEAHHVVADLRDLADALGIAAGA